MSIFVGSSGGTILFFRSPDHMCWEPTVDGWVDPQPTLSVAAEKYLISRPVIAVDVLRFQLARIGPQPNDVRASVEPFPFSPHAISRMVLHDLAWVVWVGWLSAESQRNVVKPYLGVLATLKAGGAKEAASLIQVVSPDMLRAVAEAKRKH